MSKVRVTAKLPARLHQEFLQHIRNFDIAHPGCHFEVGIDPPQMTLAKALELQEKIERGQLKFSAIMKKSKVRSVKTRRHGYNGKEMRQRLKVCRAFDAPRATQ